MAEEKKAAVDSGFREVTFLKDFGSYKKDDVETYHKTSIVKLIAGDKPIAKVTKKITKYVPKKAVL